MKEAAKQDPITSAYRYAPAPRHSRPLSPETPQFTSIERWWCRKPATPATTPTRGPVSANFHHHACAGKLSEIAHQILELLSIDFGATTNEMTGDRTVRLIVRLEFSAPASGDADCHAFRQSGESRRECRNQKGVVAVPLLFTIPSSRTHTRTHIRKSVGLVRLARLPLSAASWCDIDRRARWGRMTAARDAQAAATSQTSAVKRASFQSPGCK